MDWHRVARTVQELGQQGCGGLALWDFLDFVVTYPTPVFVLLLPFIEQHVSENVCHNQMRFEIMAPGMAEFKLTKHRYWSFGYCTVLQLNSIF